VGYRNMKVYEVQLVSKGSLTQLPDSQKLFGALVYMYSEKYSTNFASELTKKLLNKEIYFSLSNVIPQGYYPTPQDFIIDRLSKNSNEISTLKEQSSEIKMRSYIPKTELHKIFEGKKNCKEIFPYIKLENHQQLRVFIESNFYNVPELESKLYSVPTVNLLEISLDEKQNEIKKPVNKFCFYMQADGSDDAVKLLNMLNEAAETKKTVILGKRFSQGLNIFEFQNITEIVEENIDDSRANCFLNMGMLLPDKINFKSSTLKLFTSERRPFEMPGGWDKNFIRYYISFIAEGSIIVPLDDERQNAGKSIKSPFNPERDIVFGNAFLYPLHLEKGRCDHGKDGI